MNLQVWRWISSANLYRFLSPDKAEQLVQAHKLSDKKLAETWMRAISNPNEAHILTIEAAARFYAKVKFPQPPQSNRKHDQVNPARERRTRTTHKTDP